MARLLLFVFTWTLVALAASCSKHDIRLKGIDDIDVNVAGIPEDINVNAPEDITIGPDFKGASALCDERYGKGTEASEDCFLDYRDYYRVSIGFSLDEIIEFCEDQYGSDSDIEECIQNLTNLFQSVGDLPTPGA